MANREQVTRQLAEARHELLLAQSNVVFFEKKLGEFALHDTDQLADIIPFPVRIEDGGDAA